MHRAASIVTLVLPLTAGCATQAAVSGLERELALLRADVGELRHAQQIANRELGRIQDELRAVESRMAHLQASAQETAAAVERLHARVADVARAREVEARAGPGDVAPPAAAAAAPAPARSSPPDTVSPAPADARRNPATAAAGAEPRPPDGSTPERQYQAALAAFRAGEHGQAVLEFMDFVAAHPRHPLAVNAQYWIGEAYYAERDYRHALREFQKVLELGPRSAKAGDALLKIGLCHARLQDPARAREAWQRAVREHPRSQAASRAGALLVASPSP